MLPPSPGLPTSLALRRTSRRTPANCLQGQASPPDGVVDKLAGAGRNKKKNRQNRISSRGAKTFGHGLTQTIYDIINPKP